MGAFTHYSKSKAKNEQGQANISIIFKKSPNINDCIPPLGSWFFYLLISSQPVHQMCPGCWESSAGWWQGGDGGRVRAWWPVGVRHLPLCRSLLRDPTLLPFCLRAPQVVGDVWWWKALVMDLFCIHAHLTWCDSSPVSTEQPLYCLCLGVNACWMDEFYYRHKCVSVCVCSLW